MPVASPDVDRLRLLIRRAIDALQLDLGGMTVLTEAASGPFVATPLIAAMAGAEKVIAVTRDSKYATSDDVIQETARLARLLDCEKTIELCRDEPWLHAHRADLVTNLNFVRPIDSRFIGEMRPGSAISLMWETWEYRPEDLDLRAARQAGIPVLGTNERDPRLMIFEYVAVIVLKLMLEAGLEIFRNRCLLLASGHFGEVISRALKSLGADIEHWDPLKTPLSARDMPASFWNDLDAVIVAEHESKDEMIGQAGLNPAAFTSSPVVIHLCGHLDRAAMEASGIRKYPPEDVPVGYMTRTTGDVGVRPVVDLHAGGLKVGESMVRARLRGDDMHQTIEYALAESPAMVFSKEAWNAYTG